MAKHPTHDQILAMPLSQQVLAMEEYRHQARLAEIKSMAAALKLLEAEYPAIKAAGYTIYPDAISPVHGERMTLGVMGSVFDGDMRLCKALLTVRFEIVDRRHATSSIATVYLKKGRLRVRVLISRADLDRAVAAAAGSTSSERKESA